MLSMRDLAKSLCASCEPHGLDSKLSQAWETKGLPPTEATTQFAVSTPALDKTLG